MKSGWFGQMMTSMSCGVVLFVCVCMVTKHSEIIHIHTVTERKRENIESNIEYRIEQVERNALPPPDTIENWKLQWASERARENRQWHYNFMYIGFINAKNDDNNTIHTNIHNWFEWKSRRLRFGTFVPFHSIQPFAVCCAVLCSAVIWMLQDKSRGWS